jgi:signal peptidase I
VTHPDDADGQPGRPDPESGEPDPKGAPPAEPRARRHRPLWLEIVLLLVVALVLATGVKALFVQAFYIPSGSMNDTLVFDDRILVQKVSYWGPGAPRRGDVVVFDDPGGWLEPEESLRPQNPLTSVLELFGLYPTGGHLVKRVIAVGGDTVACCDEEGRVTVNDVALEEQGYLAAGSRPSVVSFRQDVPDGYLWVMGDNRAQSADSRSHLGDPGGGFVPVDNVVGKVVAVAWPLDHARVLTRPETFAAVGP